MLRLWRRLGLREWLYPLCGWAGHGSLRSDVRRGYAAGHHHKRQAQVSVTAEDEIPVAQAITSGALLETLIFEDKCFASVVCDVTACGRVAPLSGFGGTKLLWVSISRSTPAIPESNPVCWLTICAFQRCIPGIADWQHHRVYH
jgi:hypothetical protein